MKFLILLLTALTLCQSAAARDKKNDEPIKIIGHFGLSGTPSTAGNYFTKGFRSNYNYGTLSHIYRDSYGEVFTTGTFIAGVDIKFNRVIALGVDIGINSMWTESQSRITGEKSGTTTGIAAYLFPKVKLYYMNHPIVRLYGTAGIGIGKYFGYKGLKSGEDENYYDRTLQVEGELVPFGIEIGRKLFGFAEFGIGTIYMGAHVGIGYIF